MHPAAAQKSAEESPERHLPRWTEVPGCRSQPPVGQEQQDEGPILIAGVVVLRPWLHFLLAEEEKKPCNRGQRGGSFIKRVEGGDSETRTGASGRKMSL